MPTLTIEYHTEAERLQYERAIAYLQELNRVGAAAVPGTVLDACEGFALDRGRQLLRDTLAEAQRATESRPDRPDAATFATAEGEVEVLIDAGKVNTLDGWRDIKLALFLRRKAGLATTPDVWDQRDLPPPTVRSALVGPASVTGRRVGTGNWRGRCDEHAPKNRDTQARSRGRPSCGGRYSLY